MSIVKKNVANENSSARKTKQNRLMLLSNCAVSTFKNKKLHETFALIKFKMNKSIDKFLLTGDKLMSELHLK